MTRCRPHLVAPAALVVALTAIGSDGAEAACYSVYRQNTMVFRSTQTPVDLSRELHRTVPQRFGAGATMVFADSAEGCREVDEPLRGSTTTARRTDRRRAAARRSDAAVERFLERRAEPIDSEVGVQQPVGSDSVEPTTPARPAL